MTVSNYNIWTVVPLVEWTNIPTDDILISDLTLNLRLLNINYATFTCPKQIVTDTYVKIMYREVDEVFLGKVTQCKKITHTSEENTAIYEIEIAEPAIELKNKYITSVAYSGVFIMNKLGRKTLSTYIASILDGTGWVDTSDATPKGQTTVMGAGGTASAIPSLGLSVCTVWTALQRVLINMFNYGIWFEYPNLTKCVRYGTYNKDLTEYRYPPPISVNLMEKSTDYNVQGVIVYGENKDLIATEGLIGSQYKVLAYRYSGCSVQEELDAVCHKIYTDRSSPRIRYEVEFPAGTIGMREGDRIHIYDNSIGLPYVAEGYGVKDVKITMEKTVVGIGAPSITIFDVLSDKLSIIDGDVLSYQSEEIVTDYVPLLAATTNMEYGATTDVEFFIPGITFMGDLKIIPLLTDPVTEGVDIHAVDYSLTAATASTSTLEYSLKGATGEHGFEYYKDAWFPCNIDSIILSVEYIFDTKNTVGTEATWNVKWVDGETGAQTYYPLAHGTLVTSSSVRRTLRHEWSIDSKSQVKYGYPIFQFSHSGAGTSTRIKDCVMTAVIRVQRPPEVILPTITSLCTVQMKLQSKEPPTTGAIADINGFYDNTPWITVYNYINPEEYVGRTYDMTNYGVTLQNFNIGESSDLYKKRLRARLAGDANGSIKYIIQYSSVNEKTRIIQ